MSEKSISERIAALPKLPKGTTHDFPEQGTSITTFSAQECGRMEEAVSARLSLLSDAVGAYLKAVDAFDAKDTIGPNDNELLNAAESDLRAVHKALL